MNKEAYCCDNCKESSACISLKPIAITSSSQSGDESSSSLRTHQSCFMCYSSDKQSSKNVSSGRVSIFDKRELVKQNENVGEMWKEAISELVLRMYELQNEEEEKLRRDPLAILTMDDQSHNSELRRIFGVSSSSSSSKAPPPPKRKASSSGGSLHEEKALIDPTARKASKRENYYSQSTGKTRSEIMKELDDDLLREETEADGTPCSVCKSKWFVYNNLINKTII